jgi:hypothetical protein
MGESCTSGSARGARGISRPYRNQGPNPAVEDGVALENPGRVGQRIQMVLLRQSGMTQPRNCECDACVAEHSQPRAMTTAASRRSSPRRMAAATTRT